MRERILHVMKTLGKTQKEFANELCVAEGTLSSIFNGRTKPSANIVSSIHECYPEISVLWLMFGEGDMYGAGSSAPADGQSPATGASQSGATALPQGTKMPLQPSLFDPAQMPLYFDAVKNADKPQRKITEIRIFFDDGTFEVFEPKVKG